MFSCSHETHGGEVEPLGGLTAAIANEINIREFYNRLPSAANSKNTPKEQLIVVLRVYRWPPPRVFETRRQLFALFVNEKE